ncbi:hypothetical protein HN903_01570 [archaeon]|jgi:hypothetical protein|nr:hypothetical protein [archaeon]MBT7128421.1 hypothetical protein [archaeon]
MGKEKSSKEIEKILLGTSHILEIKYDEEWNFPEINFSIFKESGDERRKMFNRRYSQKIERFLGLPYIIDDFAEHSQRARWLSDSQFLYGADVIRYAMDNNSIRPMNFMIVSHALGFLSEQNYVGDDMLGFGLKRDAVKFNYKNLLDYVYTSSPKSKEHNFGLADKVSEFKQVTFQFMKFLGQ